MQLSKIVPKNSEIWNLPKSPELSDKKLLCTTSIQDQPVLYAPLNHQIIFAN